MDVYIAIRCLFLSSALSSVGPGFKSGLGVRFNLTKDIRGFSQSLQVDVASNGTLCWLSYLYLVYGRLVKIRFGKDSSRLKVTTNLPLLVESV
jgi:hypothetical protein